MITRDISIPLTQNKGVTMVNRLITVALSLLAFLALPLPSAWAQIADQEPNSSCERAQYPGITAFPLTVFGSLDSQPEAPDVDFFRVAGIPGSTVQIDLTSDDRSGQPLPDPYLGAFDANCQLIAVNDDFGGLNSRLILTIPADGVLILAVTICCDGSFQGGGIGTYRLVVDGFRSIGSVRGRILDAVTHAPLSGSGGDFAFIQLLRCETTECLSVAQQQADSNGRFNFAVDVLNQPLPIGRYQVVAIANEYEEGRSAVVQVEDAQHVDLGDIALQPFPLRFSDVVPCANVPAIGGPCRYSVKVTNRLATRLKGAAWSIVDATGTGSRVDATLFQSDRPVKLALGSLESRTVEFSFMVPATVRAGAFICARALFADDKREPYFNTVSQGSLFCLTKELGASTMRMASSKEMDQVMKRLDGRRHVKHPRRNAR